MEIKFVSRDEMNVQSRGRKPKKANVERYSNIDTLMEDGTNEVRIYGKNREAFGSLRISMYRKYDKGALKTRIVKAKQPGYYLVITKRK